MLNIAYRQECENIDTLEEEGRNERNKKIRETKKKVQDAFKRSLNFVPDLPSVNGGNTITGNLADRCFREWRQSAENMNINAELVFRFAVIIEALSLNKKINLDKFEVKNI